MQTNEQTHVQNICVFLCNEIVLCSADSQRVLQPGNPRNTAKGDAITRAKSHSGALGRTQTVTGRVRCKRFASPEGCCALLGVLWGEGFWETLTASASEAKFESAGEGPLLLSTSSCSSTLHAEASSTDSKLMYFGHAWPRFRDLDRFGLRAI